MPDDSAFVLNCMRIDSNQNSGIGAVLLSGGPGRRNHQSMHRPSVSAQVFIKVELADQAVPQMPDHLKVRCCRRAPSRTSPKPEASADIHAQPTHAATQMQPHTQHHTRTQPHKCSHHTRTQLHTQLRRHLHKMAQISLVQPQFGLHILERISKGEILEDHLMP